MAIEQKINKQDVGAALGALRNSGMYAAVEAVHAEIERLRSFARWVECSDFETIEDLQKRAHEVLEGDTIETPAPSESTQGALGTAHETSVKREPRACHLALNEWQRMFNAWINHKVGLPCEVPLWPNPAWSQDVAMVARALADDVAERHPPPADPNHTELLKKLPRVNAEFVAEIRALSRWALERRALIQKDWLSSYSQCLDGLGLTIGVESARDPRDRRIVKSRHGAERNEDDRTWLLNHILTELEDGRFAREECAAHLREELRRRNLLSTAEKSSCNYRADSGELALARNALGNLYAAVARLGRRPDVPFDADTVFAMQEAAQVLGPPYSQIKAQGE